MAGVREVEVPIAPLADLCAPRILAKFDLQIVAWKQRVHALKHCTPGAHREERKHMIEPSRIGCRGDLTGGQQRLDLGPEYEPVALLRPMQRANANPVTCEEYGALGKVDQG